MSDGTKIEWTDATWNVVNGCSVLSPGCTNCYAMKQAHRVACRRGLTRKTNGGMVWTGEVRFNEKVLLDPLRWRRPRKIFVCAHGDLFHDAVPDEWIDRVFAVMALCPQHTFQVLTKRPERMRRYFTQDDGFGRWGFIEGRAKRIARDLSPQVARAMEGRTLAHFGGSNMPNVWLGVSVEDQLRADERIPILLDTPAAVRWLSCEPLLGPVNLKHWVFESFHEPGVDWVVAGGESGPGARPMHPDWARSLRDQCAAAGVPFLFKQWGAWVSGTEAPLDFKGPSTLLREPEKLFMARVGKKKAGRLLDGVQHDGFPA